MSRHPPLRPLPLTRNGAVPGASGIPGEHVWDSWACSPNATEPSGLRSRRGVELSSKRSAAVRVEVLPCCIWQSRVGCRRRLRATLWAAPCSVSWSRRKAAGDRPP